MVTMETDDTSPRVDLRTAVPAPTTGHGTRDAVAGVVPYTDPPVPHTDPRDVSAPDTRDVPQPGPPSRLLASRAASRKARDTERDVPQPGPLSRWIASRAESRATKQRDAAQRDAIEAASRAARDTERDQLRDALSRSAASRRGPSRRTAEQRDIAPIPDWMKIVGLWLDRTFGAIPLLAPLIVSGHFTMQVFTDEPMSTPWAIALCITLALEGGVWKLSRIYEKTLLENDSTIGIRAVIGLYLLLISGMIYGHAYYQAWNDARKVNGGWITDDQATALALDWGKWGPAAGVAVMSFLGVMVWSKQARYQHRVKLRELNQVDPRAPKFATLAWFLTFRETIGALRHSVKYRISSPGEAVADWRLYRAVGRPPIWPIPPGFLWIDGTLEQVDPLVGRDVQDDDDTLTGRDGRDVPPRDAGRRPAAGLTANGTVPRAVNGTSHGTVPQLPAGRPVEDHGTRDSDGSAGQHGPRGTDAGPARGKRDDHGTRDDRGTGERDVEVDAALLKRADKAMIVTEAFDGRDGRPHWATMPDPPSIQEVIDAIDAHRKATEGAQAGFASRSIAGDVRKLIIRMRETPDLVDLVRLQLIADPPSTN